jgi:hypothetical protein
MPTPTPVFSYQAAMAQMERMLLDLGRMHHEHAAPLAHALEDHAARSARAGRSGGWRRAGL